MRLIRTLFPFLYTYDNRFKLLHQSYLPRWIVLTIDMVICAVSLALVYFLLQNTLTPYKDFESFYVQVSMLLGVNLIYFIVFKTYSGIIRHSTFKDIIKLAFSALATVTTILLFSVLFTSVIEGEIYTTTILFLYMMVSFTLHFLYRVVVKEFYQILRKERYGILKKRVAIIGVNDHTISLGTALNAELNLPYNLVSFLSREKTSKKYKVLGKPIYSIKNNFASVVKNNQIEGVFIISDSLSAQEKELIFTQCLESNIEIFNAPLLDNWKLTKNLKNQIKPIKIEDLLERDPIKIESEVIKNDIDGKTILITGGAGSIGSEIVRQVAGFNPKLVVILDQAESALHELELDLSKNNPSLTFITELANISNMFRLEMIFSRYSFDIVYHAAAYKHVPLIERNPLEAVYVNVLGTVNLSVLAVDRKVSKFVMISTDKAVNPTNVMGASKRVAEMYVQSLQESEALSTKFITTRFGNVLGSNGSVIPHFRKQISEGGPVTVTHKDIIRYFMTIPEACQLVLQAGTMGLGGEIFVFDMGQPIKILDMAKRMIQLSGLEPYKDIDIVITGLRQGEKLYEELLNDTSTSLPTHHPKIMISKVPTPSFELVNLKIKKIIKAATSKNDTEVVKLLKDLVPEYKSENSSFKFLDVDKAV